MLGTDLFGDKVNLYTGALEVVQTDVSLPGNNALPVAVGRRFIAGQEPVEGKLFGYWDLEIPHLHGVFSKDQGWRTVDQSDARCSQFSAPPQIHGSLGSGAEWNGTEYWHGSFLYVPGSGDQEILNRRFDYTQAPTGNPAYTYPLVTRNNWTFRCLSSLAPGNGGAGEGFVAISPDGTQYQFDWMVSRPLSLLTKSNSGATLFSAYTPAPSIWIPASIGGTLPPPQPAAIDANALTRKEVWILPTVITDRFGNTVTYTYDTTNKWQLNTIVSNDASGTPRTITLTYQTPSSLTSNLVTSVFDGTRTWNYSYGGAPQGTGTLTTVGLPDTSTWQLAGMYPLLREIALNGDDGCNGPGVITSPVVTGYMVHPSGARGDFTITHTRHGRSGVEYDCRLDAAYQTNWALYPKIFDTYALTKKTISGPGLPSYDWLTTYSPEASSWAPCNGCVATKTVEVTDPLGDKLRYTFGTLFRETEGQLQQTDALESTGTLVRSTQLRYAEPRNPYGESRQARGDGDLAARVKETDRRNISQQGVDFTWLASSFDPVSMRPAQVIRSSTLGMSRTESTTYDNNLAKWVLGQVAGVTESSAGKVMVLNGYNATTANLESVTRFGHLEQTMTYNADGTLATRKDGLNHATTYSNYKRGLAQNVLYADTKTESAVVNNIGLIDSTTNEVFFTTSYTYDAMGRLASITHPAGDSVAWNPTIITTTQVGTVEYDLAAGHWRQEIRTGTGYTVNYFDALLRPLYTERWDNNNRNGTIRIVKHQYEFAGRTTFESYPRRTSGELTTGVYTSYDTLGRVTATATDTEAGLLFTSTAYGNGFLKTFTDARNNGYITAYQVFDEPSENAISAMATPEAVTLYITRDIFGKPTVVTRGGLGKSATRSYVYDTSERLCKTIEPETGATVQDYDAANNIAWRASGVSLPSPTSCDTASVPGTKKITYGYDPRNRLTSTNYSDASPAITRTYTADGLPNTITSNGAVWTNTYNKRRSNVRESLVYGGVTYNIDRGYDVNGSLLQLTYPDNSVVGYTPNALGEPSQVGIYAGSITYHPSGAIAAFVYGNNIAHSMTQTVRALPDQSTDTGVINDKYSYDANANVTGIADLLPTSVSSRTMTYDALNRLQTVSAPNMWGNATYGYDTLDNLTSTTITGGSTARSSVHTINPATNRLDSISGGPAAFNFTYGYDSQGNIVLRGSQAYVFDQGNRMKSATGKATYGYDGLGHRVSVVGTDGVNRVQVYSQDGELLYIAPSGGTATKYIYLHNHLLAEQNGSTVTYNHTDGLGSPVAQSNAAGQVVNPTRYEPYGYITAGTPRTLGFTGHVSDSDTGLTYMQQRYYDPIAGRMLSIDPVTTDANTGGSFNRYVYANNNPYRYIDPDGREARGIENHYCETYNCGGGSTVTSSRGISTSARVGAVLGGIAGGVGALGCDIYSIATCAVANPAIVAGGIAGGAALGAVTGQQINNAWVQLSGLMSKATAAGKMEYQYALVAQRNGLYPDVRNGTIQLNAGDIWKYGTTIDPNGRYPSGALDSLGLRMDLQSSGTRYQVLVVEKLRLIEYAISNGALPPGNNI